MYEYVDEEFATYVPDDEHGSPCDLHSVEEGVFTHRSLLPVSKCRRRFCAGVPRDALAKYKVSYRIDLSI
jgi:hypothetical protein